MKWIYLFFVVILACSKPQTRDMSEIPDRNPVVIRQQPLGDMQNIRNREFVLNNGDAIAGVDYQFYLLKKQKFFFCEEKVTYEECKGRQAAEIERELVEDKDGVVRIMPIDQQTLSFNAQADINYSLRIIIRNKFQCRRISYTFSLCTNQNSESALTTN